MTYYADAVSDVVIRSRGAGARVEGTTSYSCVQVYISGQLVGHAIPDPLGDWSYDLPRLGILDMVFVLAVDDEDAGTDFWSVAFPVIAAYGNRIRVRVDETNDYAFGDEVRIYKGDAGDAVATTLVLTERLFPGGRYLGGYGRKYGECFGHGPWGFGYGVNYGHGYGFQFRTITWTSAPLPNGTYPIKVVVADAAGNESTAHEEDVAIDSYARPAKDLTIDSYTVGTDTMELSWTASGDIS